jgi:hypothetical protein
MDPAGISIRSFHVQPQTIALDDLRDVAVEEL